MSSKMETLFLPKNKKDHQRYISVLKKKSIRNNKIDINMDSLVNYNLFEWKKHYGTYHEHRSRDPGKIESNKGFDRL